MPTNQPTACSSIADAIDEYIDGNGTAVQIQQVEEHLSTCSGCRTYVDSYREILQLTRSAVQLDDNDRQVPDGMIERTLEKLKKT